MARVLLKDVFFEELAPGSMLETDFERVVINKGNLIFPDFFVVPFKATVSSDDDSAKADLALIERSYREWWVVEIELGNHSFEGHVLPQVRTLSRASYGEDVGRALCTTCPELELPHVLDMVKGRQPRVLVVVDAERREWIKPLRSFDAEVLALQIFRSDRNEHVFRIDGYLPVPPISVVSNCSFDNYLPRFLVVHSPALLGVAAGKMLFIRYGKYVTEWQRIDSQDKVWLAPARQNPLLRSESYQIVRTEDGSLEFREFSRQSPRRK
jgi:hypothetical protein